MDKYQHIPQEQVEEIERFLLNQMAPEERQAFAARLSEDGDLKKATAEMQLLLLGVQEASLQEKLAPFHEGIAAKQNGTKKGNARVLSLKFWLAAASVIGIIAIAAWLLLFRTSSEERLFAEYYQPDAGLVSAMGTAEDYQFERAMVDYKTGDYNAAIKGWEGLQVTRPGSDTLRYFLGSAYLANGQTDKAIAYLQAVAAGSAFAKDAQWYAGLALLKKGATKEATASIRQSGHPQSEALLARLNE